MNHFWLHRTQRLVRESSGCRGKLDGFATRDGFVLNGRGFNEAEIRWASELASRTMCGEASAKEGARSCKATRFLFALWLIAGGLIALTVWRGTIDLANAMLWSVALLGTALPDQLKSS